MRGLGFLPKSWFNFVFSWFPPFNMARLLWPNGKTWQGNMVASMGGTCFGVSRGGQWQGHDDGIPGTYVYEALALAEDDMKGKELAAYIACTIES